MKSENPRKLSRTQLLTMLRDQELEIQELKKTNAELKKRLRDRQLKIDECGSIAEASLKLTSIFEEAQKAVDIYKANCMAALDKMVADGEVSSDSQKED